MTKRVFRGRTIAGEYPQELEKPDAKGRRNRPFWFDVMSRKTGDEILSFEAEWNFRRAAGLRKFMSSSI
jgi:hypothetical protein